jgi:hypothetical protein
VTDEIMQDPKRRSNLVKFILEWLGTGSKLEAVVTCLFTEYFNVDNSNDVNTTLLEILPYHPHPEQFFLFVKALARQSAPSLKAQAIFTFA